MNKLTILGSAIALAGGWQLVQAQPPGGGGGFGPPTFDAINRADEDGNKDDHLTQEEFMAWMQARMASFGGGGPGAGGPGGGGPGAGGPGPGGRGPGAGGPGGGGMAGMFGRWDTDSDGKVTREEFEARPRGGPGGGPGAGGGAPPQ